MFARVELSVRSAFPGSLFAMVLALPLSAMAADGTSGRQLIDKILAGIEKNNSRIKSVETTIESVHIDPTVTKREVREFETPTGAKVTTVRQPRSVSQSKLILRGEEVRADSRGDDRTETWLFSGGVWTQYVHESNTAWIRNPDQMPGMHPIDPRNFASTEIRESFTDGLRTGKVIDAEITQDAAGHPIATALIEFTGGKRKGRRYRCHFDPTKNYLPTQVAYLLDDGSVNVLIELSYQEVIDGSTWFLQTATRKIFYPGATAADLDRWNSKSVWTIAEKLHVNRDIPDEAFEIDFPDGTLVRDSAHSSIHRVNSQPTPDADALTSVGDEVPAFEVQLTDGKTFNSRDAKGKVVVINFFATWCGPCVTEMPQLEKEVWQRFKSQGVVVLSVGREHTKEQVAEFQQQHELTFYVAPDTDRSVYGKFAKKMIPRNYVIDRSGKIAYQSMGYSQPKFASLVQATESELKEGQDSNGQ